MGIIEAEVSVSNEGFDLDYLRLSVQRALVGSVSGSLYGGCAALEGNQITLTWYVAPDLTEDERNDLSAAGSMVIADFPATTGSTSVSWR